MQQKMLMLGLLAAVAALWLILSWEPVAREEALENVGAQAEPTDISEPAAPPTAAPKAELAAPEQAPAEPALEPENPPDPAAPVTETPSGIKLERANPEELDMAHLPPPSASGPLQDLEKDFESAARDANSSKMETMIEQAFRLQHVPPELLESAVCHGATCRVRTRWTAQRAGGFTVAITTLAVKIEGEDMNGPLFDKNFAVGKASDRNSNGERTIDVYFRKRPQPAK